jgi:hypothetical protein
LNTKTNPTYITLKKLSEITGIGHGKLYEVSRAEGCPKIQFGARCKIHFKFPDILDFLEERNQGGFRWKAA